MIESTNNLAAYIWSLADLLRGDFKQSQYGRIILPFTLLRRLECVLEKSKGKVLAEYKKLEKQKLAEEALEKYLRKASGGLSFYNTSQMDLSKLGESDIKDNLESYIQSFSKDAREIFEHFKFSEFIAQLNDANLLYKIVQQVRQTDLSPETISNHDMGKVFEELIRRFAESSNDTAGEHFTPRDIVHLTTSLVFMNDDDVLTKPGIIRTIYDPTAGTGGFLSEGMEYVGSLNPQAVIRAFGQELNPESYAICKADMLVKGQDVSNIKFGNTLSNDQLRHEKFDYMLSNPPFGVDWKKIEKEIKDEYLEQGHDGRFGPGLPRVSDGSLLFLLHLISKLRDAVDGGGRIGIILNGSPLFTGGAGSGESEIRRHILESDLLEGIIALPTDMFYNTGIATYIWILSNKKGNKRKGKVQLIDGTGLSTKMRKSLGSKRNYIDENDMALVIRTFGSFKAVETKELDKPATQKSNRGRQSENAREEEAKTFSSKIFATHEFGYRRITIERPLRESFQFSDERIAELRFASGPLNSVMKWVYEHFADDAESPWSDDPKDKNYGNLKKHKDAIRHHIKNHFSDLKEAKIKDLFERDTWTSQKSILLSAKDLQGVIGKKQHDDMNTYDGILDKALEKLEMKLDADARKQIRYVVSWKNPEAEKVIKKIHKDAKPDPIYGLFEVDGQVVEYDSDSDLRDNENVPLDPKRSVNEINEEYFKREVQPHVPEAWIDGTKKGQDGEIGIIGYEIPFNRHFYVYKPPRDLSEIDADLDRVSGEIMELLREVHS